MSRSIDSFFSDKNDRGTSHRLNRVLCIVEGGDELSFVKRVYEVFNQPTECQDFVTDKIKLSYGKNPIGWQGDTSKQKSKSRKICNFQGGDTQEGKAPLPILESLNSEDLELYLAIVVMFDKDRDFNGGVESKAKEILEDHTNKILFVSKPCFEKESMGFFMNSGIQGYIDENYAIIENSQCRWYKQNYGECIKLNPIGNAKKLSTVISKLEKSHFEEPKLDMLLFQLIYFLQTNIREAR